MQRFKVAGDVAPARFGRIKRSPFLAHEQTIRDWLEKTPDLSFAEICARPLPGQRGPNTARRRVQPPCLDI
jgi:hypothetical protein